ncbi:hypothetical protein F5879DRAFT_994177 [Lentinula edodes]|nr:hypothetical protein F5879DRAFT_994177 [Lentinula edodes]
MELRSSTKNRKRTRDDTPSEPEQDLKPNGVLRPKKRAKKHHTPVLGIKLRKERRMPSQFRKVRGKFGLLGRLVRDVLLEICLETCARSFPEYHWQALSLLEPFTSYNILPREWINGTGKDSKYLIFNNEIAMALRTQFIALSSEEDRRVWINQKRKEYQEIEQHAHLCEIWHQNQLTQRIEELNDLRTQRVQAILGRLEVIGWREEAQCMLRGTGFPTADALTGDWHPLFNQPRRLTERGWRNIEHRLLDILSNHRAARLQYERPRICSERYSRLRQEYINILSTEDLRKPYPGVGDILTNPVFEDLIWDTPLEDDLSCASFRATLSDHLPEIINVWRPAKLQEVLEILQQARPSAKFKDLHLATTVFGCTRCGALMIFPQMFYHGCCYMNRAENTRSDNRMRIYDEFYDTGDGGWGKGPWSSRSIIFQAQSSRLAGEIVIGAGLDPAMTTSSALTFVHPTIELLGHNVNAFPERLFLTWPAALTYSSTSQTEVSLAINCFDKETSSIRAQEPLNIFTYICCARCHEEIAPRDLGSHLISAVFDSLDRLRKEIEEERVYWQEGMDAEVLSTTRDAKEAEEKLAVKLNIASTTLAQCFQKLQSQVDKISSFLDAEEGKSRMVLLHAGLQAEVLRLLEMKVLLPGELCDPDNTDLQKLEDILVRAPNDIDAYADLQKVSAETLERVFRHLLHGI